MRPITSRRRKAKAFLMASAAILAGFTAVAPAASAFGAQADWDGSTSGDWQVDANWAADTQPANNDLAVFPASAASGTRTVTNHPTLSLAGIAFDQLPAGTNTGYTIERVAGRTVTLLATDAFPENLSFIDSNLPATNTINADLVMAEPGPADETILSVDAPSRLVINGQISGAGKMRVIGIDNGVVELTGANGTYGGVIAVDTFGFLRVTNSAALGNTASGTDTSGTLQLVGPLSVAEPLVLSSGTLQSSRVGTNATSASLSGPVQLEGSNSVNVDEGVDLTINGLVSFGPLPIVGGLTKGGNGTLVLTQPNTYDGPTAVNAGRLFVNGDQTGNTVTVAGGTLGGIGIVGTVTATGGMVAPGQVTPLTGILRATGNYDQQVGATFEVDVNGATPGTEHDQLRVDGAVNLAGPLKVVGTPAAGTTFVIVNKTSAGAVTGTFQNLAEGATLTSTTGAVFKITYKGGDGNDVVLNPVASFVRVAGVDRIETAVKISQATFPTGGAASNVVLARAEEYPDALTGTPLAVQKNAPLLLTTTSALDPRVSAEITRVLGAGNTAKTVYILGGVAAISQATEDAVRALGFQVVRLAGTDRYDTAVKIARDGLANPTRILLATGTNFPDALAAGAAAANTDTPGGLGAVLLTNASVMPTVVSGYLNGRTGVTRYAIGGPASKADPTATPVVGVDRYDTSVKVALTFFSGLTPPFPGPRFVGLASGLAFPDGLAGGAHIARTPRFGPLLLTDPTALPQVVKDYLVTRSTNLVGGFVYGGTAAVSDTVLTEANTAIRGV
ncbi:MAG: cell wall-binding repeat-containing protein [Acidimicrobiales bacterium]|nr:cell wall-binding repeat-containing protein [Acidimicrobiales bacterium]